MVRAIVGANWGDEGKGKITDMLAKESDIIVRFQGGSNAGHTIINNYGKFALHLLPSGVFYNHTTSIIGNGVALNIPFLVKELNDLTSQGVPMPKILVSDRAQILMPYHILFDTYEEARLAGKSFGSTKSGIAPFYSDKYAKIGFQVNTEPSVEVDVSCFECGGKGCPLCKHTGWIEVLGGGIVHHKVLENCGIDPNEYSGLAFGIGIERIAMLKYGINNINLLYENDLRFLKQFKG